MRPIHRRFSAGPLLALALVAPAHAAQGVNLSWSRCHGEAGGTQNRAFACDTNTGAEHLVASFVLPTDLPLTSGNEVIVDLVSAADPLPQWWEFYNIGTCRMNSLSLNLVPDPSDVVCQEWQQGASVGGIGAYQSTGGVFPGLDSRHRRMKIALAVPPYALADLVANTEYFSCDIVINHLKTVGTGACGGCSGSVCLVLTSINVTTPVLANNVLLGGGTTPGSDMAHWQGTNADCRVVPVLNRSWGQVKALYK